MDGGDDCEDYDDDLCVVGRLSCCDDDVLSLFFACVL